MARDLALDREDLPKYLEYLEKAELVSVLRMKANGDAILRKMDKLYLACNFRYYSYICHTILWDIH